MTTAPDSSDDRVQPAVSICIPVYNGEGTLAETLDSAFAQDFTDLEVLLIDNASNDGTLRVAEYYRSRGLRIEHNAANIGFNGNFNRAIDLARGEMLVILSADDLLHPQMVSTLTAALRDKESVFAFSALELIDAEGRALTVQRAPFPHGKIPGRLFIEETLLRKHAVGLNSVLFRRDAMRAAGGFDARFTNSDMILQVAMARDGAVHYHDAPLAAYRVVPNSTGEQSLYARTDLLTLKLAMVDAMFAVLGDEYVHLRARARRRWLRFTENLIVVTRYRYGIRHALALLGNVLRHAPMRWLHPRFLAVSGFALLVPKAFGPGLIRAAAVLMGKDGPGLRRALASRTTAQSEAEEPPS